MIEEIAHEGTGTRIVMTECPVCGHRFGRDDLRSHHFLNEHTPDDFGLGPSTGVPA